MGHCACDVDVHVLGTFLIIHLEEVPFQYTDPRISPKLTPIRRMQFQYTFK